MFFVKRDAGGVIRRCTSTGCETISNVSVFGLAASPAGDRLSFVTTGKRGPVVQWMSTRGGLVHDVTNTETGCAPGWSSPRTLWVSRRQGKEILWTEVEVDGGRPTGKTVPGSRDCSDGPEDPVSRGPDVRVLSDRRSQLRLLPMRYLEGP